MSKISGQLLISGQFQYNCEISGISGQLGALEHLLQSGHFAHNKQSVTTVEMVNKTTECTKNKLQ